MTLPSIAKRIADELNVQEQQVSAAVGLLDEGATVPFISRYRKEVTGGLDDSQMRTLEERLRYLRELEERRTAILKSIGEQGKLTPELEHEVSIADTKNRLEDLYLPYKPKRRTKGQIAKEAGLEPLAEALLADPTLAPDVEAAKYFNAEHNINDVKSALDGAKYILMEKFSEDAELLGKLRNFLHAEATLSARAVPEKANDSSQEVQKFRDYFEHDEALKSVPSHRALAMFRGRNEGILSLAIKVGDEEARVGHPCETMVAEHWQVQDKGRAADGWLAEVVRWTWRVKLLTHLETDLLGELREKAEEEAIKVFASNLKDLLLAAPAGQKATIGLDPGMRTGVKVAVVDATGKVLDHCAIFPTPPFNKIAESEAVIVHLCKKHNVGLIAIGNGTASRETEKFVKDVLKTHKDIQATSVVVNEAGASVYSASEFAAKEFPDLDVTIRGAISIARRLQDPLAELVKIDPKSIGVGQYQHDVSQSQLARSLDAVVEDCVNAVGVEVNTASAALLARVSGLNTTIANNIVEFRNQNGAFNSRAALKKVPRLGEKTFEQAAGFLRVANGENPLDASAVHPESYSVVEKIAQKNAREIKGLIGDSTFLRGLKAAEYTDEKFGVPTVTDIIKELDKPGRDPRPEFKTAQFQEGVEEITDLVPGMILEGTVTNVTNFGAFVDIGVHQDGLVHISALSHTFIKDPRDAVKAGEIVKVKVMEVDVPRKRIALSMRLDDTPGEKVEGNSKGSGRPSQNQQRAAQRNNPAPAAMGSMGALLQQALKKNR
ncbi:Tex family protein [Cellvibrio japonicus]|uniref:S1 RNA binding domain protein n=1 Tax=Cellvibrio japonicus (strain Ueda107) TaxID=498211 RepID=B3PDW6_CELJU|nr:Tex family protein [Cellvibrio japonicus]ACE84485.1 S1 RNA binding domain protein [Cellvibrio japonicus Ueda107]QEI13450.1 RNA-binding transcriptional accessory protein [Cellvibrio japonicus]QEI17024.1 RNA-binding transcriptional accessory protein [Cellvibrio japonicus]QEI20602.1 RNA-binding transcriptional accessory protein [Cellvibrio japonicus]